MNQQDIARRIASLPAEWINKQPTTPTASELKAFMYGCEAMQRLCHEFEREGFQRIKLNTHPDFMRNEVAQG